MRFISLAQRVKRQPSMLQLECMRKYVLSASAHFNQTLMHMDCGQWPILATVLGHTELRSCPVWNSRDRTIRLDTDDHIQCTKCPPASYSSKTSDSI